MTHTRQGLTPTHVLHDEAADFDLRQHVDRALLAGVERYTHQVFVSRAELDDLTSSAPIGLTPLLRMDIRILEAQLTIEAHLRALAARPRRDVPPALHPSLPRPTTMEVTTWPRPTR
ncbi:hypothetical protein ABZ897_15900 [Nonomuraea sp. NPDC046802]|uniref:hypothetical protein n=1 Tax=Nonomuraea sp. NPDC046802 TaxID=3154919 RepID=UPI0034076760